MNRKKWKLYLIISICAWLLSACHPLDSLSENAVLPKTQEQMLTSIQADGNTNKEGSRYEVTDRFQGVDSKVSVEVDAEVSYVEQGLVLQVAERDITPEEVYSLTQILIDDNLVWEVDNSEDRMSASGYCEGDEISILSVNRREEDGRLHLFEYVRKVQKVDIRIGIDQAENLVKEVIAKAEIGDWRISYTEEFTDDEDGQWITVRCQRWYEGVPAQMNNTQLDVHSENDHAALLPEEGLIFRICGGKIAYMLWQNPLEVKAVIEPSARLLSWDAIHEKFMEYMQSEYEGWKAQHLAEDYEDETDPCVIRISEISEELVRVKLMDLEDEYYLIPSVIFSGETGIVYDNRTCWPSEDPNIIREDYWYTYAIVNALDGSVIDQTVGY